MRGGIHSPILKNKTSHLIGVPLAPFGRSLMLFAPSCEPPQIPGYAWRPWQFALPNCQFWGIRGVLSCVVRFCGRGIMRILGTSREVSKKKVLPNSRYQNWVFRIQVASNFQETKPCFNVETHQTPTSPNPTKTIY